VSAGLNPIINSSGNLPPAALAAIETLVSGSVAGALGFNVQGAVTAAQNETLNNFCDHNPCGQGLASALSSQSGNGALNPFGGSAFAIACGGGQPCNTQLLGTMLQAQGANADLALANMQTAAPYVGGTLGVALLGPEALTAAALGGAYDYAGNAYSYLTGLSKDAPNLGNSYIAGLVAGAAYPFTIADGAIAGMSRIGKIAANGYNAAVAGTGAFGAAGMTQSSPDAPAAAATIATAAGSGAKAILPGPLGNALNQMIQGAAGPLQNAIQKALGQ
jgi:filamentous hemagglutinin